MAPSLLSLPAGPDVEAGCPKQMVYGPCGGVHDDLTCEMAPISCPFAMRAGAVPWADAERALEPDAAAGHGMLATATQRPVVLTDLTVRPFDRASVEQLAGVLAEASDGLLVGEHQNRPDFSPALMSALVREAGGNPGSR
ncbi:methylenetetrahydrofolate reductase C-terminal domain-containing protein [Pseudonocardia sp. H11422]|uniref:methylenetetrahydrofolate reductase C-terminal domain-containing protein n=1 Tax=Pseudonocardia sp. H11422 TaxID=2835866 RepID=UPI001BDBE99F|nr:methylenetetrahydrofolate reductase C-terminal domain-containing protein [Pseudonocardia sp. H11422]